MYVWRITGPQVIPTITATGYDDARHQVIHFPSPGIYTVSIQVASGEGNSSVSPFPVSILGGCVHTGRVGV